MDLVTGATGIVGRELLSQLLASGASVRALHRKDSAVQATVEFITNKGISLDGLEWVLGDTRDFDDMCSAMDGCSRVFHLAALVSFSPSDAELLMDVNRGGTETVVNAMLATGLKDLIYVSSVAALGHTTKHPITEDTPFEDGPLVTAYSLSKYKAELEVWRGSEEGLSVIIVNPSVIIGEGDFSKSSGKLFSQAHAGVPVYPAGTNGFVSAHDVASATMTLANSSIRGERFILNSENLSFKDAFSMIALSVEAKPPTKVVKNWMISIAILLFRLKKLFTGKPMLAFKASMQMSQTHTQYDGTRIISALKSQGINWKYESVKEAISRVGAAYLRLHLR